MRQVNTRALNLRIYIYYVLSFSILFPKNKEDWGNWALLYVGR